MWCDVVGVEGKGLFFFLFFDATVEYGRRGICSEKVVVS